MHQEILSSLPILGAILNNISTGANNIVSLPSYGSFSGTTVTSSLSGHQLAQPVTAWLGIEYASQPIGAGRFALPSDPPEFTGVKAATQYGKVCPQEESKFHYPETTVMGEDCLCMNVFRPEDVSMDEKLPLLVWIHGGSFIYGSTWDFDGASFVASSPQPLMVVTFHYRLGSLGFLPSQLFHDAGLLNLGLQDQHHLLKFVQKHISHFGGDPGRVTVGGLSAGAHSAGFHYQYLVPEGKPVLSQAIFESGGPATRAFPDFKYPLYVKHYEGYLEGVGCNEFQDNSLTLECLRNVDIAVIQEVQDRMWQTSEHNCTWPFQPVSNAPIIPRLPSLTWKQGTFNHLPLLTSFTTNEGNMYAPTDLHTNAEALEWMHTIAPGLTALDLQIISELYPDPVTDALSPYANSPLAPQYSRLGAMYSDYSYNCAAQENAIRVSEAGVAVWKMHFNANNSRPWYRGIDHATDRTYAWAEPETQFPGVGRWLHAYWASFVVAGDPNVYRLKDAGRWPKFDEGDELGVQLRMDVNRTEVERDVIRRTGCEFWRARHERLTR